MHFRRPAQGMTRKKEEANGLMEEEAEERDGGLDVWATRGDTTTNSSSLFSHPAPGGRQWRAWPPGCGLGGRLLCPVLVLGWAAFSEPTVLYPGTEDRCGKCPECLSAE